MTSNFTLHQLEYFVAVADEGSISAAATRSHASAGAVSMSLKELEHRLGTQLFIRRKAKALTLTAAGTRARGDARRVLAAAEELQVSANTTQNALGGNLSVGCYSTLAPFLIPPVLDEFAGQHPAMRVQILEGSADEVLRAIGNGRCEIGFLYKQDLPDGMEYSVVRRSNPYVILAENHPLAASREVRLVDLVDEPLIMFDVPSARNAASMLESVGLTPRIRHLSTNIEVIRSLVARGIGYSILVQQWPIDVSYEGRPIAARPIEGVTAEQQIALAWMAGMKLTKRSQALIDFCRLTFDEDPPDLVF